MRHVDDGLDDLRAGPQRPGPGHFRPTGRVAYVGTPRERRETPDRAARRRKWEARDDRAR